MKVDINNLSGAEINESFLKSLAKKVLRGENKEDYSVSIAFVDQKEIKEINKRYRGKNKATDVLSFSETETKNFLDDKNFLGEIVICFSEIKKNQIEKVLIHGILHLLGYDHEKSGKEALEMESKEEKYLSK
jgi:probable rRNA maturation factor